MHCAVMQPSFFFGDGILTPVAEELDEEFLAKHRDLSSMGLAGQSARSFESSAGFFTEALQWMGARWLWRFLREVS